MSKRERIVYLIDIAASVPRPCQVARLLEVVEDRRRRSFGDADRGGDVSDPCGRMRSDALEHVRVVGHESPEMVFFSCT